MSTKERIETIDRDGDIDDRTIEQRGNAVFYDIFLLLDQVPGLSGETCGALAAQCERAALDAMLAYVTREEVRS